MAAKVQWDAEARIWLVERGQSLGFDLCGIAAVPHPESAEAQESERRFSEFVAAGYAGEMDYLKRETEDGAALRGGLHRAMPWARSVVVCAVNYNVEIEDAQTAPRSIDAAPPGSGWIAKYAWSGERGAEGKGVDYHEVLLPMLRELEAAILERFGAALETRCYVDTGPIVERDFAAKAGIGWIGKNNCVIAQGVGSWLLLGVIVTSLEVSSGSVSLPAADRCGTCMRCIEACPTDALLADRDPGSERMMDASRCIAYLTIEKKGHIAKDLRAPMGRQVFGCDICQEVCPWNRKAAVATEAVLPARVELVNPALEWLASMDGATFNRWFRGTPLERTRRSRVLRNVAIAMGNSGESRYAAQLKAWAAGVDAVLAEAAQWALERLRDRAV